MDELMDRALVMLGFMSEADAVSALVLADVGAEDAFLAVEAAAMLCDDVAVGYSEDFAEELSF